MPDPRFRAGRKASSLFRLRKEPSSSIKGKEKIARPSSGMGGNKKRPLSSTLCTPPPQKEHLADWETRRDAVQSLGKEGGSLRTRQNGVGKKRREGNKSAKRLPGFAARTQGKYLVEFKDRGRPLRSSGLRRESKTQCRRRPGGDGPRERLKKNHRRRTKVRQDTRVRHGTGNWQGDDSKKGKREKRTIDDRVCRGQLKNRPQPGYGKARQGDGKSSKIESGESRRNLRNGNSWSEHSKGAS